MNIPPKDDPPITLGDYAQDFQPQPLALAPDGGIAPGIGPPAGAPLPAADPRDWMCLRGPCRNFLTLRSSFDAQNEGGFKKRHYYCTAIQGTYIEIEDEVIYECNRWDPEDPAEPESVFRNMRRTRFFERNPEFLTKE